MNALNYLITASWKGKATVQAVNKDLGGLAKVGKDANRSLTELKSGLDLTRDAFAATGQLVGEFYGSLKEGAELEAEQLRYENLAASIGTTADALTGELIPATKGMVTNANLVRGASDLISLGLADTKEEVVAWSSVVSGLNLDLQVLGLTLANDSTARLDSLGLSMVDVNKRTARFVALGHEAGEAFDLAVLEALQERMVLLGDASETTAGKLQRAEVAWANLTDQGKLWLAGKFGPAIDAAATAAAQLQEAQEKVNQAVARGIITQEEARLLVNDAALGNRARQDLLVETIVTLENLIAEEERQNQVLADGKAWMDAYATSARDYNATQRILTADTDAFGWSLANVTTSHFDHVAALEAEQAAMEAARASFESSMTVVSSLSGVVAEAYGAEALGAEDAAGRIEAANAAISASYKQTAVDVLQAKLAQTIEEDGLGAATAMIQFQEALGLITPEEAATLQEIAEKTESIKNVTNEMFDEYLTDGVLSQAEIGNVATAVGLIEESAVNSDAAIAVLAEQGITNLSDLNIGAYDTETGFRDAAGAVGDLHDRVWGLPSKKIIEIEIRTTGTVPTVGGEPGGMPQYARGGLVPGPVGMPQLAVVHGGERVLTREEQRGVGGMVNNFYITNPDPRATAQEIGAILARQTRLNKAANV